MNHYGTRGGGQALVVLPLLKPVICCCVSSLKTKKHFGETFPQSNEQRAPLKVIFFNVNLDHLRPPDGDYKDVCRLAHGLQVGSSENMISRFYIEIKMMKDLVKWTCFIDHSNNFGSGL